MIDGWWFQLCLQPDAMHPFQSPTGDVLGEEPKAMWRELRAGGGAVKSGRRAGSPGGATETVGKDSVLLQIILAAIWKMDV